MAVPKKRTTRGAQGQRRSHHALTETAVVPAPGGLQIPRRLLKAATLGLLKRTK